MPIVCPDGRRAGWTSGCVIGDDHHAMATAITIEVLEAYLNCKFKAQLRLNGQQGTKSDYEGVLSESLI